MTRRLTSENLAALRVVIPRDPTVKICPSVTIHYKGKPCSVNRAYHIVKMSPRGRKPYHTLALTPEGRVFKDAVFLLTRQRSLGSGLVESQWYEMGYVFTGPMLNKSNGEPKDWDITNGLKLLEDAMCAALGVKDYRVITIYELRKVEGPWGVTATIRPYAR